MQELIEYLETRYLICKEAELTSEASTILMTIGDAKLLLEKEKEQMFDLIKFMRTNDKMGKSVEDLYNEFINQ